MYHPKISFTFLQVLKHCPLLLNFKTIMAVPLSPLTVLCTSNQFASKVPMFQNHKTVERILR